jgi:hypothetical protein
MHPLHAFEQAKHSTVFAIGFSTYPSLQRHLGFDETFLVEPAHVIQIVVLEQEPQ